MVEPYYSEDGKLNMSKLYGFEVPKGRRWCRAHLERGELVERSACVDSHPERDKWERFMEVGRR